MTSVSPVETFVPYDVGHEVSDFSLPLIDGGIGRFSDYRGKIIVLIFAANCSIN